SLSITEVLDTLPQAALLVDPDGTVVWCNDATTALHQRPRSDIVGRPFSTMSRPGLENPQEFDDSWRRLLAGETWTGEVLVDTLSGLALPMRVSRSVVRGIDGAVAGVLSLATDLSGEMKAKAALAASDERFRALVQHSSDVAVIIGPDGVVTYVSPAVESVSGYKPEDLIGTDGWSYLHPEDQAVDLWDVTDTLSKGRSITREWRMRRADGSYGWFEQTLTDLRHVPAIGGIVGNFRDVTERNQAAQAKEESEFILHRMIEYTSDASLGTDEAGIITDWNAAAERMFGWAESEAVGSDVTDLIVPDEKRAAFHRLFERVIGGTGGRFSQAPFEISALHKAGRRFPVEVSVSLVKLGEHTHLRAFIRDIAARKAAEARLAQQALTDPLTGLPNRALLRDRLATALSRLSRRPSTVAVMFLDVDRFKHVNDGLGHERGDELLVEIGKRIQSAVRTTDTVARYGGDEFVVIAEEAGTIEEVRALSDRTRALVAEPVTIAGRELYPSVSIGVAVATDGSASPDDLVRDADFAMYRAKERGGNRVELFQTSMQSLVTERFDLE
ncbi:MAG: PAS domain S-box protein, partial [Acidimicrobiales bacterium]